MVTVFFFPLPILASGRRSAAPSMATIGVLRPTRVRIARATFSSSTVANTTTVGPPDAWGLVFGLCRNDAFKRAQRKLACTLPSERVHYRRRQCVY